MKKDLYLPKVNLLVYVYYVQIYVACEKYPHELLDLSEPYYHTYAYNVYSSIYIICLNSQIFILFIDSF